MRSVLRAAALLFVAAVAITCTDAPTGPTNLKQGGTVPGRLSMAPTFSAEAARAFGQLASFGLEVTEVHVRLTAADGSTRDTVIAFPASQNQLVIEIPVAVTGTDQAFNALIELRNDQHVVLFSGTQTVIARAANLPPLTPPVIVINYTGPGKGTKTVTVSPPDTTVIANAPIPFSATAIDSSNKSVTDLLVGWTISDATLGSITQTGNFSATITGLGKRGVATVTASTPQGVAGSSRVTFVPPPARIVVIGGSGQTGVAGSALLLPFVVEVQATDNLPVPGAKVNFRSVTAGGSVQTASTTADANGRASTLLTLGNTGGTYQYEASSGALAAVTATATATPAPATAIAIVSGDGQVDSVGRLLPLPLVVKVTDQFGGAVSGATVTWTRIAGNGTVSNASSATGAAGTASVNYTLGATPSADTVRASVSGIAGTVLFSMKAISRGPANITIVAGGGQAGAQNATLPVALVARVRDALNAPIAGQTVVWTATGAGVTFATPSSLTDALGQATTAVTLGATAGVTTVTAAAGTISTTTQLTTTGTTAPTTQLQFVQGYPTALVVGGAPVTIAVQLANAQNAPVLQAGVVVTSTATRLPANQVLTLTATTNASGVATFTYPPYSTVVGSVTFAYSAPSTTSLSSLPVPLVAGAANKLVVTTQPPATAVSGQALSTAPVVQVADAGGNSVATAGLVVTVSIAGGSATPSGTVSATTDVTGKATFTGLVLSGTGTSSLQFNATGLAGVTTTNITLSANVPATMVAITPVTQSGVAGSTAPIAPGVKVTDAAGNPVAGVGINFGLGAPTGSGASVSDGTTTGQAVIIPTNALGIAQLTTWTLRTIAGLNTVGAVPQVTQNIPAIFFTTNTTAGAAAKISLVNPVPTSITVGQTFTPVPAQLLDVNDNPVAQAGVVITATGNVQPSNTTFALTATTNASGVASFNPLPYTGKIGALTFTLSAPGVTPLVTAPINVLTGPAARLVVATHAQNNVISGALLSPQPAIQIADVGSNPVALGSVPVAAAMQTTGSLLGTAVVTTDPTGLATFTNLAINAATGTQVLQYTGGGFQLVADTVVVTATAPASITKLAGDAQSGTVNTTLPVNPSVQVFDAAAHPVVGATVTFAPAAGGGSVTGATATTNSVGIATVGSWTLGTGAGSQILNVTAGSATTTFSAFAAPGTASAHFVTVQPSTAASGVLVSPQPRVQLRDAFGNDAQVPGIVVTLTANSGHTVTGNAATTSSGGLATFTGFTIAGPPGTFQVTATSSAAPGLSFNMTMTAGLPVSIVKTAGDAQSTAAGTAVPIAPSVTLLDGAGNPVGGQPVTFAVATGGGAVTGPTTITNGSGVATVGSWTLGSAVGSNTLTATSGSLSTTFTATGLPGTANGFSLVSLPSSFSVGVAPSPIQFQIVDQQNNPVPLAGVVANLNLLVSPSNQGVSTTATSAANGLVTFNLPAYIGTSGVGAVTVSSPSVPGGSNFGGIPVNPGVAASLTVTTQPSATASAGSPLAQQPVVTVVDAGGNTVAQSGFIINAFIASGPTGASLGGTLSATTVSSGQASFANISINGLVGAYTLSFANSGNVLLSPPTSTITVGPSNTRTMSIAAGDNQTGVAGAALAIAPSVKVVDQFNNPVPGVSVTFTSSNGATIAAGGPQQTLLFVTTNSSGIASLGSWTLGTSSGGYTLGVTASVTSGSPLTFNATATPPGPSSITTQSGAQTVVALGASVVPSGNITFSVKDANGNPVANGTAVNFVSNSNICAPTSSNSTTSLGTASVGYTLTTGATGGCLITATSGTVSATAKIAVVPAFATHVWFGGAAANVHAFDLNANWIQRSTTTNVAPTLSSHSPYIPNYNDGFNAQAQSAKTFSQLGIDGSAILDLNGFAFTTTSNVSARTGNVFNGTFTATGINSNVSGHFDDLVIGTGGACGTAAPERAILSQVFVNNNLTVRCRAIVDTLFTNRLGGQVGSKIDVRAGGIMAVSDTAFFAGDSLNIIDTAIVSINGNLRHGSNLRMDARSALIIGGDATFTGTTTNALGTISVSGNATFDGTAGAVYAFQSGQLVLAKSFTQLGSGSVFITSGSHLTIFNTTVPSLIDFADAVNNFFGSMQIAPGADVTATSNVKQAFSNGSSPLTVLGKLTLPTGKSWTAAGQLDVFTGAALIVNGTMTNTTCGSVAAGTITGTGTINGSSSPSYYPQVCQ